MQSNRVQTVFRKLSDISKQIEQRARVGKIFGRWNLAIAITSNYIWHSLLVNQNLALIPLFLGARSHVALRVWVPYVPKRLGGWARQVIRSWVKITQGFRVI